MKAPPSNRGVAGAGFDGVVKLHVYSTDIDAHYSTIAAYRKMHFSTPVPSTTLQVSRLVLPQWLLEIEDQALLSWPALRSLDRLGA